MQAHTNIAILHLEHDLDVTLVDATRAALEHMRSQGAKRIVLDLGQVRYVDSAGMALLLGEVRRSRQAGGLLSLVNVDDVVMAIFRRARLIDFVPVSGRTSLSEPSCTCPHKLPRWRSSIAIDGSDLAHTRALVAGLLAQTSLSDDERFDAALAVGEAMGNAVDHASGCSALVTVAEYDDRVLMEVSDCGPGFDPDGVDAPCDPCAERGRGIALMHLLSDAVSIGHRSGRTGTVVRIVKLTRHER